MTGLVLLLLGIAAGAVWWHLVKGREKARAVAALACREHLLVLMDDTVLLDAVRLFRRDGRLSYGLRYRFDFAHEGRLHHGGSVLVTPRGPATVVIETRDGQLIEEIRPT